MNPIQIIGGGLAGLVLGIRLRNEQVPVTIIEAGVYPRHRVCGEFISGRGVTALRELGVEEILFQRGARLARTACFHFESKNTGIRHLPDEALCVSRYVLDAVLAERFQKLGGILITGVRNSDAPEPGLVFANGRRAERADDDGWRWFGLKVHARGAKLEADLEMHLAKNAYVGLCRLEGGLVNVCGLFRARAGACGPPSLRGGAGTALFERLRDASFDPESECAIAALSLHPQKVDSHICRIGDALTMIPPITGNGMSMAFESAQLATVELVQYARGKESWAATTFAIAAALEQAFSKRLWWADRLHRALFCDSIRQSVGPFLLWNEWAWRKAFAVTRK